MNTQPRVRSDLRTVNRQLEKENATLKAAINKLQGTLSAVKIERDLALRALEASNE